MTKINRGQFFKFCIRYGISVSIATCQYCGECTPIKEEGDE